MHIVPPKRLNCLGGIFAEYLADWVAGRKDQEKAFFFDGGVVQIPGNVRRGIECKVKEAVLHVLHHGFIAALCEIDADMGVQILKAPEYIGHQIGAVGAADSQADGSRAVLADIGKTSVHLLFRVQNGFDIVDVAFACGGDGKRHVVPVEQTDPQVALNGGHDLAQIGLGDKKRVRRL